MFRYGPNKLTTVELLALILGSGNRGQNVLELSRKVLLKFAQQNLANASPVELEQTYGLGKGRASAIAASFELGRRFLGDKKTEIIYSGEDIWRALKDIVKHKKEYFIIFYLDARSQEIEREIISVGTVSASLVHPREVFEPAIAKLASGIVVAHNHPSNLLEPSREDIMTTSRLVQAGEILGIPVLDHVIVSRSGYYSFKDHNLLSSG